MDCYYSEHLLTANSEFPCSSLHFGKQNKWPDKEKGYSARDLMIIESCRAGN